MRRACIVHEQIQQLHVHVRQRRRGTRSGARGDAVMDDDGFTCIVKVFVETEDVGALQPYDASYKPGNQSSNNHAFQV